MPFQLSIRVEPHEAHVVTEVYRDWLTPEQIAQIKSLGEDGRGCLILRQDHFVEIVMDPIDENHQNA